MRGSLLRVGVLVLAACVGLACSDDDEGTGPEDGVREITMQGRAFAPATLTIDAGTTVRWVGDVEPHTITPENDQQPGVWSRAVVGVGEDFEHTFEEAGETYNYLCEFHPGMVGTIIVE